MVLDGDVGEPLCGLDAGLVGELKGTIDAVINVAGVEATQRLAHVAVEDHDLLAQELVEPRPMRFAQRLERLARRLPPKRISLDCPGRDRTSR